MYNKYSMLANRVEKLMPSPTLSVSAKANELKSKGINIISFGAGEPDFDTPDFIKEGAIKALNEGKTKYSDSWGILELRKALSEKLYKENKISYHEKEIVISSGAKMALFLIFMAILNKDDEVIVPSPFWVTYPEQITLFDGKPVFLELKEENNFKLCLDDVKKSTTNKTKAIIINSPSNPTGALFDKEELIKIAEFCVEKNILIISDECYEKFVYDGKEFISIASIDEKVKNITFTVNAFSKTFSMTGWRVGYVACPESFAKTIANLNSQSISNVTTFAQYGALEGLRNEKAKEYINNMISTFEKRRNLAIEELRKEKAKFVYPEGAFYLFLDFRDYKNIFNSDIELANFLLEKANVALVPGSAFGKEFWARISYSLKEEQIKEGIRRIYKALNEKR